MPTLPHLRPSRRPARLSPPVAARSRPAVVDCAAYVDGQRLPGDRPDDVALDQVRRTGHGFVWIGLHEPDEAELAGLASQFDLHPLAVEDAVQAHQRPKLERYDDMLFVVLKTVRYVKSDESTDDREVVETGEVMVFLGRDFVITVRHGEHGSLHGLRQMLEADPGRLAHGPSAVLHAITDQVVDSYLLVCDALQEDVDAVESAVFAGQSRSQDAERIYVLKREVLELRRAVAPLTAPLRMLAERPLRLVNAEIREYFRDAEDHLARVNEQVASFDELLTTIVHANLARVTVEQNEDMRRISAWVAILAVPTAVAGVYGMNFDHMPELHWRFGYPLVVALTLALCISLHRGFRRNGWL
ncbi:MAG: magnesium transporter [Mycobacteriales bacterium]|jgi:magnesium transporter